MMEVCQWSGLFVEMNGFEGNITRGNRDISLFLHASSPQEKEENVIIKS